MCIYLYVWVYMYIYIYMCVMKNIIYTRDSSVVTIVTRISWLDRVI